MANGKFGSCLFGSSTRSEVSEHRLWCLCVQPTIPSLCLFGWIFGLFLFWRALDFPLDPPKEFNFLQRGRYSCLGEERVHREKVVFCLHPPNSAFYIFLATQDMSLKGWALGAQRPGFVRSFGNSHEVCS